MLSRLLLYTTILFFQASIIQAQSTIAREWLNGQTQIFKTTGREKAKGLDALIKLPISYQFNEGERPNIVGKFSFDEEPDAPLIMILIKRNADYIGIEDEVTAKDLADISADEMVGKTLVLSSEDNIHIDGLKVFAIEILNTRFASTNLVNSDLQLLMSSYNLFWNDYMISVQFAFAQLEINETRLVERLKAYKPLMTAIMNTLVITSKWK